MVAVEVEIDPRGGLVQLPVSRWYIVFEKGRQFTDMIQAVVRPYPYASFIRVNLTGTVPAAAAGTVTRMFGTSGFWTYEGCMLDATIAATLAGQ